MKVLIYIIKLDSGDIFQISVIFFTFNMKNDKKCRILGVIGTPWTIFIFIYIWSN